MSLAGKLTALLTALSRGDLEALTPMQRRTLALECERVHHAIMMIEIAAPKTGILARLARGERPQ